LSFLRIVTLGGKLLNMFMPTWNVLSEHKIGWPLVYEEKLIPCINIEYR